MGMRANGLRTVAAAIAAALAAAGGGAAAAAKIGPSPGKGLGEFFFGPKLARAEVVIVENGVVHDYRIDRGRIRFVGRGMIELKELDGSVEKIPVSPTAEILVQGGRTGQLERGMIATTIRDGNAPADRVFAAPPPRRR